MSTRKKKKSVDAFRWPLLQNYEIWKSKSEQTNASFPLEVTRPNWDKPQILGWKWCSQEPQAHITNPFKHFYFFSLPKLLAWGKRYILAFKLHSFSAGAVFLSPPLLGVQPYSSQDAVDEDGHDGGTDQARDGHSHKPRHEDVSEQTPVYCLPWAQPSYCNHRAHLETQQSSDKSHQLP